MASEGVSGSFKQTRAAQAGLAGKQAGSVKDALLINAACANPAGFRATSIIFRTISSTIASAFTVCQDPDVNSPSCNGARLRTGCRSLTAAPAIVREQSWQRARNALCVQRDV